MRFLLSRSRPAIRLLLPLFGVSLILTVLPIAFDTKPALGATEPQLESVSLDSASIMPGDSFDLIVTVPGATEFVASGWWRPSGQFGVPLEREGGGWVGNPLITQVGDVFTQTFDTPTNLASGTWLVDAVDVVGSGGIRYAFLNPLTQGAGLTNCTDGFDVFGTDRSCASDVLGDFGGLSVGGTNFAGPTPILTSMSVDPASGAAWDQTEVTLKISGVVDVTTISLSTADESKGAPLFQTETAKAIAGGLEVTMQVASNVEPGLYRVRSVEVFDAIDEVYYFESAFFSDGGTVCPDFGDWGNCETPVLDDITFEILEGGTPPPPPDTFTDDDDSVFTTDIEWMAAVGVTKGCNPPVNDRFCPDAVVTRGQMAAFLVRALNLTDRLVNPFVDDDDSIFEADIERLAAAGITKGCNPPDNTRFCPDGKVTRQQMAAFLVRALSYTDDGGGDLFTDDDGSVFEADIDRLGIAGVTKGCNPPDNTRFCPTGNVTRGQMAAFLHRALG